MLAGLRRASLDLWNRKPGRRVIGLSLWLLASSLAHAQQGIPGPPRSGVVVQVRGSDGRGVANASVELANANGFVVGRGATNVDGVARVLDVPPGSYQVRIQAAGIAPAIQTVAVAPASMATVDVALETTRSVPDATGRLPRPAGSVTPPADEPLDAPLESRLPSPREVPPVPEALAPMPPDAEVFASLPDRWTIVVPEEARYGERGAGPRVARPWWDPYHRNPVKGDYPVAGQRTFFAFTGVSTTQFEGRSGPAGPARSSNQALSGQGRQDLSAAVFRTSFDLFRGDTAYRPVDWRVRVQPAMSVNYLQASEAGVVNRDVREGTTRLATHLGFQEAFVEKKLATLSSDYDFLSVRAGIQEFGTDFRGFLATVEQPGVRVFGTLRSSRVEYNVAFFDFLEKDTNSGFNQFRRRHQQMAVANVYIQDALVPGYTTSFNVHINRDTGRPHDDANGFPVRPASSESGAPHGVRASYLGWAGNGHLGRLNLSHAFYQAFGTDEFNALAGRRVDIDARMVAAELSVDKDWLRLKGAIVWSSGDNNPSDETARGFDAIVDTPVFAGGAFSFWNRQSLELPQTEIGLVGPLSLLPNLRTNKDESQANFVNPGIFILQGGADADLTPKLRVFSTVSVLRFEHTEPLEALFHTPIRNALGTDVGGGLQYRPPLSDNVVLSAGLSALRLGAGLRDIYGRHYFVSFFANMRLQF